jgi:hypothetical protein
MRMRVKVSRRIGGVKLLLRKPFSRVDERGGYEEASGRGQEEVRGG